MNKYEKLLDPGETVSKTWRGNRIPSGAFKLETVGTLVLTDRRLLFSPDSLQILASPTWASNLDQIRHAESEPHEKAQQRGILSLDLADHSTERFSLVLNEAEEIVTSLRPALQLKEARHDLPVSETIGGDGPLFEVRFTPEQRRTCKLATLREWLVTGLVTPSMKVRQAPDTTKKPPGEEPKWQVIGGAFKSSHVQIHELFSPVLAHVSYRFKAGSGCLGMLAIVVILVWICFEDSKGFFSEPFDGKVRGLLCVLAASLAGGLVGAISGLVYGIKNKTSVPGLPGHRNSP